MGSSNKITIGYRYFMGLHSMVCRGPIDKLLSIRFGDKIAWQGEVTDNQEIFVDNPELFGGEEKEGGVQGYVDVMFGKQAQTKNPYLQSKLGLIIPAFRGVFSLVYKGFYFAALNPYFKPVSYEVERIPAKDWLPSYCNINNAANPIHCIYELITSSDYAVRYGTSLLNLDMFESAAITCFNEGLGVSFVMRDGNNYEEVIDMLMTHINGVFRTNNSTGEVEIKLLRGDYDINDLIILDESNSELMNYERPSYSDVVNEITVSYRPQGKTKDDVITVQNIAAIAAQNGAVVSQTVSYKAFDSFEAAKYAANRDIIQKSTPLARVKIKANRIASKLQIGDCFVLSNTAKSIESLVCRIISIDYGTIEDNTCSIEAIEDIFGLQYADYIITQNSGWVDESSNPQAILGSKKVELNFWDLYKNNYNIDLITQDTAFLGLICPKQEFFSFNFELWTPTGNKPTNTSNSKEYPLYDVLTTSGIGATTTSIPINIKASDFYWCGENSEVVISDGLNEESMTVVSLTDTLLTVATRTGFAFATGSYVNLGYGSNNPVAIGHALTDTTNIINSWEADVNSGYIVVNGYYLIDSEVVKVTSYAGGFGVAGIARGEMGTAATAHNKGHYMRRLYIPETLTGIYEKKDSGSYCAIATTKTNYSYTDKTISLFSIKGDYNSVVLGSYGYWEDEIVRVDYVSPSLILLGRGCLDTVPAYHNSGSQILFSENRTAKSDFEYSKDEDVELKALSRTSKGLYNVDLASTQTLTMQGRAFKPYPVGKFRINGLAYPEVISGQLDLTWEHRNRLLQLESVIDESATGISLENDAYYNIKIYGESLTLIKEVEPFTLDTYQFTDELQLSNLWEDFGVIFSVDAESSLSGWTCETIPTGNTIPSITQSSSQHFNGTYSLQYSENGFYGECRKETVEPFNFEITDLFLSFAVYCVDGEKPTIWLEDETSTGFNCYGIEFSSGDDTVKLLKRTIVSGTETITTVTTISQILTSSSWYKCTLNLIKNEDFEIKIYNNSNVLLSTTTSSFTGLTISSREAVSYIAISKNAYYDDITLNMQELRYNEELRVVITTIRGVSESYQKIDYSLARTNTRP